MTERRMMLKKITDSDALTEIPLSSQVLYFRLLLRTDDDGFLDNVRKIMRDVDANQSNYDMLLMKCFLIQLEDGACVIKHWRIHSHIQKDRYKPTLYTGGLSLLTQRENGAYSLVTDCERPGNNSDTKCTQTDSTMSTLDVQVRLDRDRIGIGKDIIVSDDTIYRTDIQRVMETWSQLGINPIGRIASTPTRHKMISVRIEECGVDGTLKAIGKINESTLLEDGGSRGWMIDFEWLSRPDNFLETLEGRYDDKKPNSNSWEG